MTSDIIPGLRSHSINDSTFSMIHVCSLKTLDCLNLLCHGLLRKNQNRCFDVVTCSSLMFSDRCLEFLILIEKRACRCTVSISRIGFRSDHLLAVASRGSELLGELLRSQCRVRDQHHRMSGCCHSLASLWSWLFGSMRECDAAARLP